MRDRDWLRQFLRLDARAGLLTVPEADVHRQEDTVLRALEMLDAQPGIVLADEVGMGKTYEALGIIAARHHEDPARRTLVLTPGPDLNTKWKGEFVSFGDRTHTMYPGFEGKFGAANSLGELLHVFADDTKRVAIAPVTMFAGSRATKHNVYLLSLFFHWKELRGNQSAAAFRRYRHGQHERLDPTTERFLDEVGWDRIEPIVAQVMAGGAGRKPVALDAAFAELGYELFDRTDRVDDLLAEIRFRLLGALLPELDLLVIDEAHKLKNASSTRATAVREAFDGKFAKALFLTATPFQLDVAELRQILALFSLARGAKDEVRQSADALFADIRAYQSAYDAFRSAWKRLDGDGVAEFASLHERDPALASDVEDPGVRTVVALARRLFELKRTRVEPGFRRWMIRSLREDKRTYRKHHRHVLPTAEGDAVPFLVYERFIAELFRSKSRTHKAAVQINMVSSYGAARDGAILSEDVKTGLSADAESYRQLLRKVLDPELRDESAGHPKIAFVVDDALAAADRGEKTLIFCARVHTLVELRRRIEQAWLDRLVERWRRVDPAASRETIFDVNDDEERMRGRHSRLQLRFQRTQDALYLALRERYLQTVVDIGSFGVDHIDPIVRRANEVLAAQRVAGTRATRFDWALAKRCVESAAAIEWRDSGKASRDDLEELELLASPDFVRWGYDHTPDDLEPDDVGDRAPEWSISADEARVILAPTPHLWSFLKSTLHSIPRDARVRAVERLARYLTKREVPFLCDVMAAAKASGHDVDEVSSRDLLGFVDRFWRTPEGKPWKELLWQFLQHLGKLDEARRTELLDGAIAAGELVRHTRDGESRERLREAFNTPLYPMVLVANEVMQEGLDLHHQCARVVHHDLAWNPAQLEQRVGRVDRLGSLLHRRRSKDPSATLDVHHPLVAKTIDVRLDRTVRAREKWLEFLLGDPGMIDEHGLADEPVSELPLAFAEQLRIDLGPSPSPS